MNFRLFFYWLISIPGKIVFLFVFFAFFVFADRYSHLELFAQSLTLIQKNYFKPVKMETLVYGAIKGLLREVDPHSHLLLPERLDSFKEESHGEFYGFGMEVEKKGDFLIVLFVMADSPAEKAGLLAGDQIVEIGGKITKNFNREDFRHYLKKIKKKNYTITILRPGLDKALNISIQPRRLNMKSVGFKKLEKGLFYIRIHYFSKKTLYEIHKFLKDKTIEGLVLDIRGNPGGVFDQVVKVADLFLSEGLIVKYKIKTEKQIKEFPAHRSNSLANFKLVVLIDEYSASGSEIIAGALKDHKRAVLIGRKTFGKGSIQEIFSLVNNHALKLTVGEYQTPSGKVIHNQGIEPDIHIPRQDTEGGPGKSGENKDLEMEKALEILKKRI